VPEGKYILKWSEFPPGAYLADIRQGARSIDVPPGDYKLFAWETLPTGADASAEFMSPYEERGRFITITAGSTLSDISLPLIEN